MNKQEFGSFIAENRKAAGLTQRALAERLHVTDKAVSKWERGLSYPDVTLLEPLAEALGLSTEELMSCEKKESGEPVKALLEISRENRRTEGRRIILRTLLITLAVLGAALAVMRYADRYVSEQRRDAIYLKETENGVNYLYVEQEGHLLRLRCAPGVDFDKIEQTDENGSRLVYLLDCRWNRKTYEGTVKGCEEIGITISQKDLLFAHAGLFETQSVQQMFGVPLVYYSSENYFPDPYGEGKVYLRDYRFWMGRWWDSKAGEWKEPGEHDLLRIERCMAATVADIDNDGEPEVIARTRWPESPYAVYDWDGEDIVHRWQDSVPEELRKDLRCILVS